MPYSIVPVKYFLIYLKNLCLCRKAPMVFPDFLCIKKSEKDKMLAAFYPSRHVLKSQTADDQSDHPPFLLTPNPP